MSGKISHIFLGALIINCSVIIAQNPSDGAKVPIFTAVETTFDFGTISEKDGYAEHTFKFKNTGTAPLVVNRVTASCGCTKPEWSQAPIEPGKEGFIIITYNPKGHIGPFNKVATVYTNENDGFKRFNLTITGNVVEKPSDPGVTFEKMSGNMGVEKKNLVFKSFNYSTINKIAIYIKNYNSETVYFSWDNVPDYISIEAPDSLKADWPGEITFAIDGSKTTTKRGRVTEKLSWTIKNNKGQTLGRDQFTFTVNYIDDFSKLSPLQSVSAPSLEIKNTLLEFGEIKKKLFSGTTNKPIILTNIGKSDLIIHSMNGDDERVHLPDMKGKAIKAGESFTVNASIKAKELNSETLDTEIYVVCNDPKGPVRRIKVTAGKIN